MSPEQLQPLIFLFLMVGIFYFLLIRPQKRRVEEHRRLLESVEEGDEIITIGGLVGTVTSLRDDEMEVEVSPGTRIRFVKSAIARRVTENSEDVTGEDAAAEEEETT